MINHKVMSMCPNIPYCNGWNDAVDEIKNNKYVVFIDEELYKNMPKYYPPVGTVGKILIENEDGYEIEWFCKNIEKNFWRTALKSVIKLHF